MNPCIIIPAYNAGKTIGSVIRACRRYIGAVVVIDDGSTDQTTFLAEEAGAIALKHRDNRGKGASLKTAFSYVLGTHWDVFLLMDADGQHDPDDIPAFLEAHMEDHASLLVGNRMSNPAGMPFVRLATNRVMSALISFLIKQDVPDTQCGYKMIPRRVLAGMNLESSNYDAETEILFRASCADVRIKSVPVRSIYADEESSIRPLPDTLRFVRLVLSFWKMRKKGLSRKDMARKRAAGNAGESRQPVPPVAAPEPPREEPVPAAPQAAPKQEKKRPPETRAVKKKSQPKPQPPREDELPMDYS